MSTARKAKASNRRERILSPTIENPVDDFQVKFEGNRVVLKYQYTGEERYFINEHQQLKKITVKQNSETVPVTTLVVGHDKHGYILLREVFTRPLHPNLNPMPDAMTFREVLDLYKGFEISKKIEFNDLDCV